LRRNLRSGLTGAAVAALVLAVAADPAAAHPHVWIDARTEVAFDDQGRVTALRVSWRFDEFYSLFAIEGLDKNADGVLEAEELRPLAELNVTSLKEVDYFTHVKVNGVDAAFGEARDPLSTFQDGILSLEFVIPLQTPVDPRQAVVSLVSYDPTFYIAVEPLLQDPVSFTGSAPPQCRAVEEEGGAGEALSLSEADFLDPAVSEGIGALYATEFTISCGPVESVR
jgi:ABC-type uncharacterized transport system substrate-binding protein